jgi:uncharacterized protein YqgC (DUF456 family)
VDLSDTNTAATVVAAVAIVVGIAGVILPVIPGLVVCWLGVLVWTLFADAGGAKWGVFAGVTVVALSATVVKYAWPGRNLKRRGVSNWSLFVGGVLAIVGFFLVPVVGLVLGFILGIFLAERVRLRDTGLAWRSTKHGMKAVGLSILIELGAALIIGVTWVLAVVLL